MCLTVSKAMTRKSRKVQKTKSLIHDISIISYPRLYTYNVQQIQQTHKYLPSFISFTLCKSNVLLPRKDKIRLYFF